MSGRVFSTARALGGTATIVSFAAILPVTLAVHLSSRRLLSVV